MLNSLDRHLRSPDQHDGLPFHPDCPVCRSRVAGTPPSGGVLSRQTQAALAAGVLAVTAVGPTAAVAAPPRAPAAPVDPTLDPDWQAPGPEGESGTESAEEAPPTVDDGGGGGEEETGAVEREPVADTLPELQSGEAPPTSAPSEQPPAAPPAGAPPAPIQTVEAPASQPAAPGAGPAGGRLVDGAADRGEAPRRLSLRQRAREVITRSAPTPQPTSPGPVAAAEAPVAAPAAAATATPASSTTPIKGDTYRVREGDSLWSIAERVLGSDASTGQVARKVHQLWTLNADEIATGNPNLLPVGTVLRLR